MKPLTWLVFCRVVDNFGDAGVCIRLSKALAKKGHRVILWIDDPSLLLWMAPELNQNIEVYHWLVSTSSLDAKDPIESLNVANVVIEAFGCELPIHIQTELATLSTQTKQNNDKKVIWINLEYLSAEPASYKNHCLMSPVLSGPARGAIKWFFYPGFETLTGGLIREEHTFDNLIEDQDQKSFLEQGLPFKIGLFCYDIAPLQILFEWCQSMYIINQLKTMIRVPIGSGQNRLRELTSSGHFKRQITETQIEYLPPISQERFDQYLQANDLNFVRGEDSLVRAIWSGKPWIWQIYPQSDFAHVKKLNSLLDLLCCPPLVRSLHETWNLIDQQCKDERANYLKLPGPLEQEKWSEWQHWCIEIRSKLTRQTDLITQLEKFVDLKLQKTVE
jgi:uncharacterized repeat protein (TIGR03837 family)